MQKYLTPMKAVALSLALFCLPVAFGDGLGEELNEFLRSPVMPVKYSDEPWHAEIASPLGLLEFLLSVNRLYPQLAEHRSTMSDYYHKELRFLLRQAAYLKGLHDFRSDLLSTVVGPVETLSIQSGVVWERDPEAVARLRQQIKSDIEALLKEDEILFIEPSTSLPALLAQLSASPKVARRWLRLSPLVAFYNSEPRPVLSRAILLGRLEELDEAGLISLYGDAYQQEQLRTVSEMVELQQTGLQGDRPRLRAWPGYIQSVRNQFIDKDVRHATELHRKFKNFDDTVEITLQEVPPLLSLLRGRFGMDCSQASVPMFSLLKNSRVFFLWQGSETAKNPAGYVFIHEVQYQGRKLPYIVTVNATDEVGPGELQITLTHLVQKLGYDEFLVPDLSANMYVANGEASKKALQFSKKKKVAVDMGPDWQKLFEGPNGSSMENNYYDPKSLAQAYLEKIDESAGEAVTVSQVSPASSLRKPIGLSDSGLLQQARLQEWLGSLGLPRVLSSTGALDFLRNSSDSAISMEVEIEALLELKQAAFKGAFIDEDLFSSLQELLKRISLTEAEFDQLALGYQVLIARSSADEAFKSKLDELVATIETESPDPQKLWGLDWESADELISYSKLLTSIRAKDNPSSGEARPARRGGSDSSPDRTRQSPMQALAEATQSLFGVQLDVEGDGTSLLDGNMGELFNLSIEATQLAGNTTMRLRRRVDEGDTLAAATLQAWQQLLRRINDFEGEKRQEFVAHLAKDEQFVESMSSLINLDSDELRVLIESIQSENLTVIGLENLGQRGAGGGTGEATGSSDRTKNCIELLTQQRQVRDALTPAQGAGE